MRQVLFPLLEPFLDLLAVEERLVDVLVVLPVGIGDVPPVLGVLFGLVYHFVVLLFLVLSQRLQGLLQSPGSLVVAYEGLGVVIENNIVKFGFDDLGAGGAILGS